MQHFLAVPFLVGGSDMIATVPRRLAQALVAASNTRMLKPPLVVEGYTLHVVWHRRHDHDPVLRWVRERLCESAAA